ncbi:MAG: glycosyltransferase family 92 protein [Synergistaceae bacterium]|nr:glycosyltransferase family 92 protein [Synergistaceae bacterium]
MKKFLRERIPGLYNFLKKIQDLMYCTGEGSYFVSHCREYTNNESIRNTLRYITGSYRILKYFFHGRTKNLNRNGLAIVLIIKNEAQYILEWINFHVKQGVSHFFIYDNESTDNLFEVLQPFIANGLVTYNRIPGKVRQTDAYNHAIYNYKHKFKYFAMIDTDEFLFTPDNTQSGALYNFIDNLMTHHENAGGVAVNWLVFGSNGHESKPAGGVLENFTMCVEHDNPGNFHIKTICDPLKVFCWYHVHFPLYYREFYNLSENGEIIDGPFSKTVSFDKIRINHYVYKSKEEFIQKIARGRADVDIKRKLEDFHGHECNINTDTEILSHI